MKRAISHRLGTILSLAVLPVGAAAETGASPGPQPAPPPPPIAVPQDIAYPGTIWLSVDATDLDRRIFKVHETIPVAGAGPVTLLYPQWLPGNHSPSGPIEMLGGLIMHAGSTRIEWQRDPVSMFAFHVTVPAGVTSLDLDFQFLSPVEKDEGRVQVTRDLLNLQWTELVFYPAGYFARRIAVQPSVALPKDWHFGTALVPASASGGTTTFTTVTLNNLVDSPMFAGRYFDRVDLDPDGKVPVHMDVVADRPDELTITPAQLAAHRSLVQQAYRLFGSHHYEHYDFLLAVSDKMSGIGLEHHQSSEDGTIAQYFTDWDKTSAGRDLLPHEFTHSWNGKFRRPADLWTPNFNVPMGDSLLWVYEGQTQYWGYVLAARSGLWSKQEALDALAATAATYDYHLGRAWRALEDTTMAPIIARRRPIPWVSWQRTEDYYSEGQLNWLDIDTLIRQESAGKRSLDDFARNFFGIDDGSVVTVTYGFDDVVHALADVQSHDWAALLKSRLDGHAKGAPLDGLTRGGYRLVYTDTPTEYWMSVDKRRKTTDLSFSIGLILNKDGAVSQVQWDSPAFKAGIDVGTQIVAINGEAFDLDLLKETIRLAKDGKMPIELLIKDDGSFRTVSVDDHDGLRYPRLERVEGTPALLDDILAPKG
jgi:predicted metalloprotease with PDZ domain